VLQIEGLRLVLKPLFTNTFTVYIKL